MLLRTGISSANINAWFYIVHIVIGRTYHIKSNQSQSTRISPPTGYFLTTNSRETSNPCEKDPSSRPGPISRGGF